MLSSVHVMRCGLVWLAATGTALLATEFTLPPCREALSHAQGGQFRSQPFELLLVWLCAPVALVACVWLWWSATLVLWSVVRGRVPSARGCPAQVRQVLLAACGVAIISTTAVPAHALAPVASRAPTTVSDTMPLPLAGLPLPDRVAGAASAGPQPAIHIVRKGDTLWAIAKAMLPVGAGPMEVATQAHQLHQQNRQVLGPNPDLIYPGQQLRLTTSEEH